MAGIKESKEFIIGNMELAVFLISRLKDGADFSDALAIFEKLTSDSEFKDLLQVAYQGSSAIREEALDIDLREGAELGMLIISYLPKLINGLK